MAIQQNKIGRFKDAPWIREVLPEITILGLGGIGSNTLFNLSRSIPARYYLFDHDTVEEHNTATQFFTLNTTGLNKVDAVHHVINLFSNPSNIRPISANINLFSKAEDYLKPITITGFDNMAARKKAFEDWKTLPNRELFIDGRLRATSYEVYCVTPSREERYQETLFEDSDIPDDPCTFKQTTFFGMMIGARITNLVTNYLTNKYLEEDVCDIPFKFKELGELCHVEISE